MFFEKRHQLQSNLVPQIIGLEVRTVVTEARFFAFR